MDAMGTMRGLDQIREQEDGVGSSRLMSLALGGLATACVLFAIGVMVGREAGESRSATREDPLARLDQLAQQAEGAQAAMVTYPERLTGSAPTAALAAAPPPPAGAAAASEAGPVLLAGAAMPPAAIRPVGTGFGAPTLAPVAGLTGAAPLAPVAASGPAATPGSEGAFSVQVSSFRAVQAAQGFASRLRERGHRAFVAAPATAPNGVVWHRVRIGPFATLREANQYRVTFEARERMPTILVRREPDPAATAARRRAAAPLQAAAHAPAVR